MPSLEIDTPTPVPEQEEQEAPVTKPVVGIIYPPPEVRNIVDKTASFVARNGPDFESRIRQHEQNNTKFNFLNPTDPYHAYYQHKVKEFTEGKANEPTTKTNLFQSVAQQQQRQELLQIQEPAAPKEPPPEYEFVADPPSISAFELDVVKLTAQFVARNGRQFLTNLMNKEQRNYQFDFLRPQHSLFNYFTKLVEQYTKILIPPKDLLSTLRIECDNPKLTMAKVKQRVDWSKYQERERKKEADAIERDRVAYAQIDWHDFVVVETVDFQISETDNLPPPTTADEVGARLLAQERYEKGELDDAMDVESDEEDEDDEEETVPEKRVIPMDSGDEEEEESSDEDDKEDGEEVGDDDDELPSLPPPPPDHPDDVEIQDMEEDSDEEIIPPLPPPPPSQLPISLPPPKPLPLDVPLPPAPDKVVIRKDYDPKAKMVSMDAAPDEFMVSPITGEKIPTKKVHEHMRIGLLDPKWIEERNKSISEKREQEEVFAPGTDIDSSLKQLAERRTDIFGVGVEETQIGKKIGEAEPSKKDTKEVWDGHTASMEKVTQKARENINLTEQLEEIQRQKGLLPDAEKEKIGPKPVPPSTPAPPPPPQPALPKQAPPMPPVAPAVPLPAPPAPPPVRFVNAAPPIAGMMVMQPRPPVPIIGIRQPMMMRPGFPVRPMPPRPQITRKLDDEPPAKKAKTEENLTPEQDFLSANTSPVTFKVLIPHMPDKTEWDLHGQFLTFTLPLTDTISVLKAKIHEKLGMPAGKQKVQFDGLFMKESNTLAFYNFTPNCIITLQLKERGGRKK